MQEQDSSQELEIRKTTHTLIVTISLFIVGIITWSAYSTLDIVSSARGTIIPMSKVQKIQHLEGGIIQQINVQVGQKVTADQPLIILSPVNNLSEVGELKLRIDSLTIDNIRLDAESKGSKQLAFPPQIEQQHPLMIQAVNRLFSARIASINSKKKAQKKTIEEILSRVRNSRTRLKFAQEQVKIGERLLKQKLSNRYEQLERLKEANSIKSKIDEDLIAIKRAKEQLNQIQAEYKEDIQLRLSENKQNIQEFTKRLDRFQDSLQRTVLKAPMDGIIKRVYIETIGGVIKPGDTIIEIVPGEDKLIVEAMLLPQEIGHINIDQKAFVQLDGADGYRYGKVSGTVIHVSPDSLITQDGEAFFIVQIALENNHFGDEQKKINLFPGMVVNTGIILGKRSVMGYILSPFLENMSFILTEK